MKLLVEKRDISTLRACELAGVPRSSHYYEPRPREISVPMDDVHAEVLRVHEERPSFGYRRNAAMVRRRLGRRVNEKKVRRIMRDEHITLAACVQPARVRIPKQRGRQVVPTPDVAYQMDLKYIDCGNDKWAYLTSAIDCCTGEWLAYVFGYGCSQRESIELLDKIVADRFPTT